MSNTLNIALEYIKNTGGGATRDIFIEDHEPIGEMIFNDIDSAGLVKTIDGKLFLTEKGELHLASN